MPLKICLALYLVALGLLPTVWASEKVEPDIEKVPNFFSEENEDGAIYVLMDRFKWSPDLKADYFSHRLGIAIGSLSSPKDEVTRNAAREAMAAQIPTLKTRAAQFKEWVIVLGLPGIYDKDAGGFRITQEVFIPTRAGNYLDLVFSRNILIPVSADAAEAAMKRDAWQGAKVRFTFRPMELRPPRTDIDMPGYIKIYANPVLAQLVLADGTVLGSTPVSVELVPENR